MTMNGQTQTKEDRTATARVVEVLDQFHVVINRGERDGLKVGVRYLVYGLGPDLTDPETGESLGHLEVVRGVGAVTHVQEKVATLQSTRQSRPSKRRVVRKPTSFLSSLGGVEEEMFDDVEDLPFDDARKGDYVRRT